MKKIFIPFFITLAVNAALPCYSHPLFEADNDYYWLNNVRNYKKYRLVPYYSEVYAYNQPNTQMQTLSVREYPKNTTVSANVGQRMIDLTTYTITTETDNSEKYQFQEDALIYCAAKEINIHKGDAETPIGEIKMNGEYYMILPIKNSRYVAIVDSSGRLYNALGHLDEDSVIVSKQVTLFNPPILTVKPYSKNSQSVGKPQLIYEVIYDGMKDNEMSFIYQSGRDLNHAQRYTFPADQKNVTMGDNVTFEIMKVTPDNIEYKIM